MRNSKTKFCAIVASLLVAFAGESSAQTIKEIPVYPGAILVTAEEPGTEAQCCSFSTADSFEKVLSFYQSALRSKPMDTKQLAAAYPAMKEQLQQFELQMPSTMKYRAFVLDEMELNGKKGAMLFEITATPAGVNFTIPENTILQQDAHFVLLWREQTGRLTPEKKAGRLIVDWKQLQGALPAVATVGELKRGEVTGETNREGPTPSSSVNVTYIKPGLPSTGGEDSPPQIGVAVTLTIEDAGNNQEYATDMTSAAARNEKATTVRGKYKGKERSEKNESGYESCEIAFLVNKRFIVDCKGERTKDLALIRKLIDGMNLEKLADLK